ncbi:MAG: DUF3820 family protein [Bacteroidota bacterium]
MELQPDRRVLLEIVSTEMPFGKYKGRLICDIPVYYLVWCQQKGAFPKGRIGELMQNALEIKTNNLGYILEEIKSWKYK